MKKMNYRQGLNQPQMFQELGEYYTLPNPQYVVDWVIFFIVMFIMAFPLNFISRFINHVGVWAEPFTLVLFPFAIVLLIKSLKPDGKKIYYYLYDYALYFFQYKLFGYRVYKGRKIKPEQHPSVYQKVSYKVKR